MRIVLLVILAAIGVVFVGTRNRTAARETSAPVEYSVDPVCQMDASPDLDSVVYKGVTYRFCSDVCKELFEKDPERFAVK